MTNFLEKHPFVAVKSCFFFVLSKLFVFKLDEKLKFFNKKIDFTVFLSILVKSNEFYLVVKIQLQRIDLFTNDSMNY